MLRINLEFWFVECLLCFGLWSGIISGHGRLREPPSRSSMWRNGYSTPVNYNDNQLFCGGFKYQQTQEGRCGLCGDPWGKKAENEAGGKYATGLIVRRYRQHGVMPVNVEITAHHFGWFEFRLCANNDPTKRITEECLERGLLTMVNGSTRYYLHQGQGSATYRLLVRLPKTITCTQCVLQWKYHTGNNWGVDRETGNRCLGCGPQEEFYGCADIAIYPLMTNLDQEIYLNFNHNYVNKYHRENNQWIPYDEARSGTTTVGHNGNQSFHRHNHDQQNSVMDLNRENVTLGAQTHLLRRMIKPFECRKYIPTTPFRRVRGMLKWCERMCSTGKCPRTHCRCKSATLHNLSTFYLTQEISHCRPVKKYEMTPGFSDYCKSRCKIRTRCPKTLCQCDH